jgi:hypothetical protein
VIILSSIFEQKVQINNQSLHVLIIVKDLRQEVPLKLREERQRVLGDPYFFSPLKKLNRPNVDLLQVDLVSSEYFSADIIGLFVHSTDLNNFIG